MEENKNSPKCDCKWIVLLILFLLGGNCKVSKKLSELLAKRYEEK